MNKILLNTIGVGVLIALGAIIFGVIELTTLSNKNANNQARFECAQISKYQVTTDDATVSYPVADVYKKCLLEKGLK